jgi:hypothetical protein
MDDASTEPVRSQLGQTGTTGAATRYNRGERSIGRSDISRACFENATTVAAGQHSDGPTRGRAGETDLVLPKTDLLWI